MKTKLPLSLLACLALVFGMFTSAASAQNRISDKDVESLMRNVRDDAKTFRPLFDNAIRKSAIRKTSQEKDAREMVKRFEKQTERMLDKFKSSKRGDQAVAEVQTAAEQIDAIVYRQQLEARTVTQWEKIKSELHQLNLAFGTPERYTGAPMGMASLAPALR